MAAHELAGVAAEAKLTVDRRSVGVDPQVNDSLVPLQSACPGPGWLAVGDSAAGSEPDPEAGPRPALSARRPLADKPRRK